MARSHQNSLRMLLGGLLDLGDHLLGWRSHRPLGIESYRLLIFFERARHVAFVQSDVALKNVRSR